MKAWHFSWFLRGGEEEGAKSTLGEGCSKLKEQEWRH